MKMQPMDVEVNLNMHLTMGGHRVVILDIETGEWLFGSGVIAGEEGARLAASLLPGMPAELIAQAYADWLNDQAAAPEPEPDVDEEQAPIEPLVVTTQLILFGAEHFIRVGSSRGPGRDVRYNPGSINAHRDAIEQVYGNVTIRHLSTREVDNTNEWRVFPATPESGR